MTSIELGRKSLFTQLPSSSIHFSGLQHTFQAYSYRSSFVGGQPRQHVRALAGADGLGHGFLDLDSSERRPGQLALYGSIILLAVPSGIANIDSSPHCALTSRCPSTISEDCTTGTMVALASLGQCGGQVKRSLER